MKKVVMVVLMTVQMVGACSAYNPAVDNEHDILEESVCHSAELVVINETEQEIPLKFVFQLRAKTPEERKLFTATVACLPNCAQRMSTYFSKDLLGSARTLDIHIPKKRTWWTIVGLENDTKVIDYKRWDCCVTYGFVHLISRFQEHEIDYHSYGWSTRSGNEDWLCTLKAQSGWLKEAACIQTNTNELSPVKYPSMCTTYSEEFCKSWRGLKFTGKNGKESEFIFPEGFFDYSKKHLLNIVSGEEPGTFEVKKHEYV